MSYDIVQQVFGVSMMANLGSGRHGTDAELLAAFDLAVAAELRDPNAPVSGWRIVWGPQIFSWGNSHRWAELLPKARKLLDVVDNAMLVAHHEPTNTYVVGIAGTNPISLFGWFIEDFDVWRGQMVKFPFALTGELPRPVDGPAAADIQTQAYVSHGTAVGVRDLLAMKDPRTGATLQAFLDGVADKAKSTLIFAGHSLGGALSPTTALSLYPDPKQSGWADVFVLATAGATPGNRVYQRLYNTAYPSTPVPGVSAKYGLWNTMMWNNFDIVPHAWNQLTQVIIPNKETGWMSIFGPVTNELGELLVAVSGYARASALGGVYSQLDCLRFSPPDPSTWPSLTTEITDIKGFLAALGEQHVTNYAAYFGVPESKGSDGQPHGLKAAILEPT